MRVTGGAFAAGRLPENYYGMFIKEAQKGGMAAVCATEQYQERIAANPQTRDRLMAMDPKQYIKVMSNWMDQFIASTKTEVFGMTDADLAAITVPTVVIPGNDQTHASVNGRIAAAENPRLRAAPAADQGPGDPADQLHRMGASRGRDRADIPGDHAEGRRAEPSTGSRGIVSLAGLLAAMVSMRCDRCCSCCCAAAFRRRRAQRASRAGRSAAGVRRRRVAQHRPAQVPASARRLCRRARRQAGARSDHRRPQQAHRGRLRRMVGRQLAEAADRLDA